MNKDHLNYTITWAQPLADWVPLNIELKPQESNEPEITDFTEAQEVLAKIMSKI